jgi:hypothetical protein
VTFLAFSSPTPTRGLSPTSKVQTLSPSAIFLRLLARAQPSKHFCATGGVLVFACTNVKNFGLPSQVRAPIKKPCHAVARLSSFTKILAIKN